jgi:hypothetical protein
MTNPLQKTPQALAIEKGKWLVIATIAYFVTTEALLLVINLSSGQPIALIDLLRSIITVIACVFLYRGHRWAKLLLLLGACLATFYNVNTLLAIITTPGSDFFALAMALFVSLLSGLSAYYLIFSHAVDEFLFSQKP